MKRRLIIIILAFLVIFVGGCGKTAEENSSTIVINPVEEDKENTQQIPEDLTIGENYYEGEETQDNFAIETSFITLYYPSQWKDSLRTEENLLVVGSDVKFYGSISGNEYWLFTVHFGGEDNGIPVGAIKTAKGYMLDVTIEMSDLSFDEDWKEEDKIKFSAMQEALNHVVYHISQTEDFEG